MALERGHGRSLGPFYCSRSCGSGAQLVSDGQPGVPLALLLHPMGLSRLEHQLKAGLKEKTLAASLLLMME